MKLVFSECEYEICDFTFSINNNNLQIFEQTVTCSLKNTDIEALSREIMEYFHGSFEIHHENTVYQFNRFRFENAQLMANELSDVNVSVFFTKLFDYEESEEIKENENNGEE